MQKPTTQIDQRPPCLVSAFKGDWKALEGMDNFDPNVTYPSCFNNTLLTAAIANGRNEYAYKFIAKFGNKIDFLKQSLNNNNALFLMLTKGYTDISLSGDKFDKQYSALNIAKKIKGTIKDIDFKELINQKCTLDNTALHIACARRDTETIKFLIDSGADIKSKNASGLTPFDMLDMEYEDACNLCGRITESCFLLDKTLYDKFDKEQISKESSPINTNNRQLPPINTNNRQLPPINTGYKKLPPINTNNKQPLQHI